MIRSAKQRLRRIEGLLDRLHDAQTTVTDQNCYAADEAWLAKDEEGNRVGPEDDVNDKTRRVFEMLVRMEAATCRDVEAEEV